MSAPARRLPDHEFAALAREHRIPFDELLDRYDRGLRGEALLESRFVFKGEEWLSTQEVVGLLDRTSVLIATANLDFPDWCRRRPWSKHARDARGCGMLYWRADVEHLASIMRARNLPMRTAARMVHRARAIGEAA